MDIAFIALVWGNVKLLAYCSTVPFTPLQLLLWGSHFDVCQHLCSCLLQLDFSAFKLLIFQQCLGKWLSCTNQYQVQMEDRHMLRAITKSISPINLPHLPSLIWINEVAFSFSSAGCPQFSMIPADVAPYCICVWPIFANPNILSVGDWTCLVLHRYGNKWHLSHWWLWARGTTFTELSHVCSIFSI